MSHSQFNPLVSIIIPVYNGANYLKDAIFSALAQTYNNTEIIVVNDGSNDQGATEKIAQSFGSSIRYIHQKNGGVASALNTGIEQMRGDYFSWLSHDDLYLPHKITTQIEYLSSLPNKESVLYSNYELINENREHLANVRHDHTMLTTKPLYGLLRGCIHGCSMLIPKIAFERFGSFNTSLKTTQDYDLWFSMILKIPFVHMQDILIQSRWHEQQDSKKNINTLTEGNTLWKKFIDNIPSELILSYEYSEYQFYKKLAIFLATTPFSDAKNHADEISKKIKKSLVSNISNTCVTVIIPFHNRVLWTIEAILSVQSQTHTNLEILVIDNNSTDDITRLLEYIKYDSRIKYHKQTSPGVSQARNLGLEIASGDYICFLDSDDLWIKNKVEIQLKEMIENDAVFSHTAYQAFDKEEHLAAFSHKDADFSFPAIIKYCGIATPTVMLKRTIVDTNNFRFLHYLPIGEDVCLWICIASKYSPHYVDTITTYVRLHGKNAAYDKDKETLGLINIASFVGNNFPLSLIAEEFDYLKTILQDRLSSEMSATITKKTPIITAGESANNKLSLKRIKQKIKNTRLCKYIGARLCSHSHS